MRDKSELQNICLNLKAILEWLSNTRFDTREHSLKILHYIQAHFHDPQDPSLIYRAIFLTSLKPPSSVLTLDHRQWYAAFGDESTPIEDTAFQYLCHLATHLVKYGLEHKLTLSVGHLEFYTRRVDLFRAPRRTSDD